MPGFGHLNIGENQGGAQIFAPNPVVQQYAQMLWQRQAKHDLEVKQLGDTLAKGYDPAGLRDADKPPYMKMYIDIRDSAIAAENEKNPTKKALGLSEVRQRLNDLSAFADRSKATGTLYQSIQKEHALHPYNVSNDTFNNLTKANGMAWNDPNNPIKSWGDVVRGVDPEKMYQTYQKHKTALTKDTQWVDYKGKEDIQAGKKGEWHYQQRGLPMEGDNGAFEGTLHMATYDLDFQKGLHDMYPPDKYPQLQNTNPQVDLALKTRQYMTDNGDAGGFMESSKPEFKEDRDKSLTPYQLIQIRHWNQEHGGIGGQPLSDINIPFGDKSNVNAKNYAPVSLAKKNFAGSPAIDMSTGKPIPALSSSDDYSMNGVGDFPVMKSTGELVQPDAEKKYPNGVEYKRMVHVSQNDRADNRHDYLIPYDRLPHNVANQKDVKQALTPLNNTGVYGQQPKSYKIPTGTYKGTVSANQIHEKAAKAGVSDQEYLDWLSKQ